MSNLTPGGFQKGDFIEVTPRESDKGGGVGDFGVLRGTAMNTLPRSGSATFQILLMIGGMPTTMTLSCNTVDVRLLFSAHVARDA